MNEQQELIEELQVSDEMGWERADYFEKELKQKKIYIKRLKYKVQKFKEENDQLKKQAKKQILRIHCQDKEIQRLLEELE